MATQKTYLIGYTRAGAVVARASSSDKGYSFAAVRTPAKFTAGQIIPTAGACFSTTAAGAINNAGKCYAATVEVVPVLKTDAANYRRITGKS